MLSRRAKRARVHRRRRRASYQEESSILVSLLLLVHSVHLSFSTIVVIIIGDSSKENVVGAK
jgi:hypothetical protein